MKPGAPIDVALIVCTITRGPTYLKWTVILVFKGGAPLPSPVVLG